MNVAWSAPQGAHYLCGRYLLAYLTGNKEGSKIYMEIRSRPTITRFPTNINCGATPVIGKGVFAQSVYAQ